MPTVARRWRRRRRWGPAGRALRLVHLTTSDVSLALLLSTELEAAQDEGYEVIGMSAPGPYVARLPAGVRHVPVSSLTRSWNPLRDIRALWEIVALVRRLRPDVLHTHNPKTGVLGRWAGRACGVPVVVNTCHGLWLREGDGLLRRLVVIGAEAAGALGSDVELFQNDDDRRRMARFVGPSKCRTVGNGVDLTRFRPDVEAGARFREELGIPMDSLLVGGVGRRVAEKGIHDLAEASEHVPGEANFIWVGPRDLAKPDNVDNAGGRLRFVDEQEDMVAVYAALDVFVLPSYREGFSRSAMEAAACGCAMVLTDIRGCREIGSDEEHLLLVPPGEPRALAESISRLVADGALRRRLGSAAQSRAREAFDQRSVAAASFTAYRDLAARRGLEWFDRAPVARPPDPERLRS